MKTLYVVLALTLSSFSTSWAASPGTDPDADYDRMDGTGVSGKTVNVIEWEGNLEIHVTPKGSLAGLGLKLDKRNKDKPVMVIAYRFDNAPRSVQIRRAILGIDLREGFHVYRDRTALDYDKIVITNNQLASSDLAAFRLDPAPTQLYPDGHPALAQAPEKGRKVASNDDDSAVADEPKAHKSKKKSQPTEEDEERAAQMRLQQDGTITPFFARPGHAEHGKRDRRRVSEMDSADE